MKFEIFTPIVIHELGQRTNQEDSVFPALGSASDSDRLFLVCDGMGGHSKGEVASANVVEAMTTWIKQRTPHNGIVTDDIIEDALQCAHHRLDQLDDGAENKMGTTLTLVCLHKGGVSMGHVGDSRIYHVRPSQREILYKSIDHSLVYELYKTGVISYEEMATSPQRNVITRAIMPGDENNDKIDIAHTTNVQPGDYFYLCSDGMLEEMSDDQLLNVLCADASDVMKASSLVSMTADNKDNHTALLIKVKSVLAEEGDENLLNDEAESGFNEMAIVEPVVVLGGNKTEAMPKTERTVDAPKAQIPQANMSQQRASAPVASQKKGVNKILVMLVLLLLALVVAGAVYLFLGKGNGSKKSHDSNDNEAKTEKVDKDRDNDDDADYDFGDDDFNKGSKRGYKSDNIRPEDNQGNVDNKNKVENKEKKNVNKEEPKKKEEPKIEEPKRDDKNDNGGQGIGSQLNPNGKNGVGIDIRGGDN